MHEGEIEHCQAAARLCMERDGRCDPVLIGYGADGRQVCMGLRDLMDDKDAVAQVLRAAVVKYVTVILVVEAWLAMLNPAEQAAGVLPRPSTHPRRQEAVLFSVYQKGAEQHLFAIIHRSGGRITLGLWTDMTALAAAGRFCQVLEQQVDEVSVN